jgi:hypothetical protein
MTGAKGTAANMGYRTWRASLGRRWKKASSATRVLIPSGLGIVFSIIGHFLGMTTWVSHRLADQTQIAVSDSRGKLANYAYPITKPNDEEHPGSIRIAHPPCNESEQNCYVQLTPKLSNVSSVIVSLGALFSGLSGFFGLALMLTFSRKSVIRGRLLEVHHRIDEHEVHHTRADYYDVVTDEEELRVPIGLYFYLPTFDGTDVKLVALEPALLPDAEGRLPGNSLDMTPQFQPTPVYDGHVIFANRTRGPINFSVSQRVVGNMALDAERYMRRWQGRPSAPTDTPEDDLEWRSSIDWDEVKVEVEWVGLRITGVPIVLTARDPGGNFEPVKEGFRVLSPSRWELRLKSVSAHTIYRFVWKLDKPPAQAQAVAAGHP